MTKVSLMLMVLCLAAVSPGVIKNGLNNVFCGKRTLAAIDPQKIVKDSKGTEMLGFACKKPNENSAAEMFMVNSQINKTLLSEIELCCSDSVVCEGIKMRVTEFSGRPLYRIVTLGNGLIQEESIDLTCSEARLNVGKFCFENGTTSLSDLINWTTRKYNGVSLPPQLNLLTAGNLNNLADCNKYQKNVKSFNRLMRSDNVTAKEAVEMMNDASIWEETHKIVEEEKEMEEYFNTLQKHEKEMKKLIDQGKAMETRIKTAEVLVLNGNVTAMAELNRLERLQNENREQLKKTEEKVTELSLILTRETTNRKAREEELEGKLSNFTMRYTQLAIKQSEARMNDTIKQSGQAVLTESKVYTNKKVGELGLQILLGQAESTFTDMKLNCEDDWTKERYPCTCVKEAKEISCDFKVVQDRMGWGRHQCVVGNIKFGEWTFRDAINVNTKGCWEQIGEESISEESFKQIRTDFMDRDFQKVSKGSKELACRNVCFGEDQQSHSGDILHAVTFEKNGTASKQLSFLKKKCECLYYREPCQVDILLTPDTVQVTMSAKFGDYNIALDGVVSGDSFKMSKLYTHKLNKATRGLLTVICNGRKSQKQYNWSRKDYCEYVNSGKLKFFQKLLCLNDDILLTLGYALSSLLIGLVFKGYISTLLAVAFSPLIVLLIRCFEKRLVCVTCQRLKWLNHSCPPNCIFCSKDISKDYLDFSREVDLKYATHLQTCLHVKVKTSLARLTVTIFKTIHRAVAGVIKYVGNPVCLMLILLNLSYVRANGIDNILEQSKKLKEVSRVSDCFDMQLAVRKEASLVNFVLMYTKLAMFLLATTWLIFMYVIYLIKKSKTCQFCKKITTVRKVEVPFMTQRYMMSCYDCLMKLGICIFEEDFLLGKIQKVTNLIMKDKRAMVKMVRVEDFFDFLIRRNEMGLTLKKLVLFSMISLLPCVISVEVKLFSDLENKSFTANSIPFSGHERRSLITEVVSNAICDSNKCQVAPVVKFEARAISGRALGYTFYIKDEEGKSTPVDLNGKFLESGALCHYTVEYDTFETTVTSGTSDQCTKDCDDCYKDLNSTYTEGRYFHCQKGTSSWSCDGPGCMSINSGSTCGACNCKKKEGTEEWTVKKLVKTSSFATFCIQFNNEVHCKQLMDDDVTGSLKSQKLSNTEMQCPELIACSKSTGVCRHGEMNSANEFTKKFGNVQLIGGKLQFIDNHMKYQKCHFGLNRMFLYTECCGNLFRLVETLKDFSHPTLEKQPNVHVFPGEDGGLWKLEFSAPSFEYQKNEDNLVIKECEVSNCKGCFNCDEGAECDIRSKASHDGIVPISSTGCSLDSSRMKVSVNGGTFKVRIYCGDEKPAFNVTIGKQKCTSKNKVVLNTKAKMYSPLMYYETSGTKGGEGCETIFCGFGMPDLGTVLWSVLGVILLLVLGLTLPLFREIIAVIMSVFIVSSVTKVKENKHRR
uniref:Putative RNA dependent RNA polymerase n=1 Tax=Frankliniella occidentalis associated peribunyavirus-like virus 2 TaxID=2771468 RepID=A0A7H1D348_9VIRU|nr:putative RNA dependent RNA polymerase [Frankliniella occidentalis associated peribunyavirus-like virus 2]